MSDKYSRTYRVQLVREYSMEGRPRIKSTSESREYLRGWYADRCDAREVFSIVMLNTRHQVIGVTVITEGTLDASLVHPREVFAPAIVANASSIILTHNHPSGDPTPSPEDHQVTTKLTDAGKLLGIDVLDHIIHGDGTGETISIREC